MSRHGHGPQLVEGARFARWHVDPANGRATPEIRSEVSADFPTINQAFLGRRNRHTYAAVFPGGALRRHALMKHDGETGATTLREFPEGQLAGERWFVAAPDGRAEDEGWLLSLVSDLRSRRGALHVLDATDLRAPPVAVIHLPGWVPAGVHGSWVVGLRAVVTRRGA